MAIQTKLDPTKSFAKVISEGGVFYSQNGLTFDGQHYRVSEITKEEALAEIANEAAEKARAEALAAGDAAAKAIMDSDERIADEKAAENPAAEKEMPDFTGFTKKRMIDYAAQHFRVNVDPKLNHAPMVKLLQGLF